MKFWSIHPSYKTSHLWLSPYTLYVQPSKHKNITNFGSFEVSWLRTSRYIGDCSVISGIIFYNTSPCCTTSLGKWKMLSIKKLIYKNQLPYSRFLNRLYNQRQWSEKINKTAESTDYKINIWNLHTTDNESVM